MARRPRTTGAEAPARGAAARNSDPTAAMGGLLVALGTDLSRLLDHLTRRHGSLTYSQYQLLALLRSTHPEPWEPWELGKRLGNGSAHVTMLLDQLERAGLVARETHVHDRRRRLIRLTFEGHDRVERLGAQVRRVEEHIFGSALSDDELGQLRTAAERLRSLLAEFTAPDLSFLLVAEPGRPPVGE